jgi:hypothetical protein
MTLRQRDIVEIAFFTGRTHQTGMKIKIPLKNTGPAFVF